MQRVPAFTVGEWWFTSHWTLSVYWLPEWLLANLLPHGAKRLYPFSVSGERGVPGTSPLPPPPCSSKTRMIREEGWSGWGVKIPLRFPAFGARAIQFNAPENPPQWRRAEGARSPSIALVADPHSGLFVPHVRDIPEVILGKVTEMETSSKQGHDSVLHPVVLEPLLPPVGTQQAGSWPCQWGLYSFNILRGHWYRAVWIYDNELNDWFFLDSIILVLKMAVTSSCNQLVTMCRCCVTTKCTSDTLSTQEA